MGMFDTLAVLITLSALFSYVNHRYIRLPTTIGILVIALGLSLMLLVAGALGFPFEEQARTLLSAVDFNEALLHGMLAFLLFAGSIHINLEDLARQKWMIGWLATMGVIGSTLLIGTLFWLVLQWVGYPVSFLFCLLFGALISPTDPIAVLGILKTAGVPKSLETSITGESLFNDGVGVVVFMVLFQFQKSGGEIHLAEVASLFLQETGGGILMGILLGYIAYHMLKSVDNYQVEILITLALVTGGYALSGFLHISGPIAVVVAGLLIGNHGRMLAMSERTIRHLDTFWELIDEILNAVLFLLLGLEVLILELRWEMIGITLSAVGIVLVSRWISVSIPVLMFRWFRTFPPRVIRILTWGGLRGGISVALALSLPPGQARDLFLPVTYGIVVFSVAVQGLTIRRLVGNRT